MAARPATAGPYSVRSHDGPSTERASPGESYKPKTIATPKTISGSPRRTVPRVRPGHSATLSETGMPTPSKPATSKAAASPRTSPAKPELVPSNLHSSSSSNDNEEDLTLVVPSVTSLNQSFSSPPRASPRTSPGPIGPIEDADIISRESATSTPQKPLKVYEDPFTAEEAPQSTPTGSIAERPVLEDRPVNEAMANLSRASADPDASHAEPGSAEKNPQTTRLLDSAIARVKAQTLDVHGFRKIQSLIRGDGAGKSLFAAGEDKKFDALLAGLFAYLESPLDSLGAEKVQDVRTQVLATVKLMLKRHQDRFRPHVARGLESLLATRALYQARNHIVSGLELLADELVAIGDAGEITATMTRNLGRLDVATTAAAAAAAAGGSNTSSNGSQGRSLSMGLHVLKQLLAAERPSSSGSGTKEAFVPDDAEIAALAALCSRCIESTESAVRMDTVQLCVTLHARLGEARFWDAMKDVRDDPKSLITYYVVKRQREREAGSFSSAAA